MIYKQGPLWEDIFALYLSSSIHLFISCVLLTGILNNSIYIIHNITIILLFYLLLCMFTIFSVLRLEWFYFYEDRIVVRNIFKKIKNVVFIEKIVSVEETYLLYNMFHFRKFIIFDDGRNNDNRNYSLYCDHNKRKNNVKIYATNKMEKIVKEKLKFEIKKISNIKIK